MPENEIEPWVLGGMVENDDEVHFVVKKSIAGCLIVIGTRDRGKQGGFSTSSKSTRG